MSSHKKTYFTGLCLAILILVGTVVSAKGTTEQVQKSSSSTEVVFWHSSSGLAGDAMTTLIRKFNDTVGAAEGIVVREIYQGKPADVATKLRATMQGGRNADLPNIAQLDASGVIDIRDSQYLIPINELDEADETFSIDELQPGAVLSTTYKGKVLGMPFNSSTIVLYYNKDAFFEAGLDSPPETLAELADYAKALVKKTPDGKNIERYGFGGVPTTYELVSWIGQQNGLSYLTDNANGHEGNPTKVVFDENGTLATFLDEWRKVYQSGGLVNLTANVRQEFAAGKIAMHAASTSGLSTLLASIDGRFELGVGFFPKVNEQATGGVNVGGGALFMFDTGNLGEREATWKFLTYLMNSESQFVWHKATGYFPVNMGTYRLPEFVHHLEQNPLFAVAIEQLNASNPDLLSVWWPNSYQAYYEIQNQIIEMLEKNLDTQKTVDSISSTINRYIEDYNRMNKE